MELICHAVSPSVRHMMIVCADTAGGIVRIDLTSAALFKGKLSAVAMECDMIVLDLSHVTFIDSSGLGALLSCVRDLTTRGGELRVCCVQQRVMIMFNLVRLPKIIGVFDTLEEALATV